MYPGGFWNYGDIAGNPNTTREYILEHYFGVKSLNEEVVIDSYTMSRISMNTNITVEDVLNHPDSEWNFIRIAGNGNFTLDDVLMLSKSDVGSLSKSRFDPVRYYSMNPRLTWEDVMARDIDEWNWYCVTQHSWVTESMLRDTQYPWRAGGVALNPNLTMSTAINNSLSMFMYEVSRNPGITWKDIVDNPEYRWSWRGISRNPNITFKIVLENLLKEWDWRALSRHPNITWDMIIENPDLPWKKRCVSLNPNITWDIIRDNPEWPWDWRYLSKNKFSKHNMEQIILFFRAHIISKKIINICHIPTITLNRDCLAEILREYFLPDHMKYVRRYHRI